jgi:membrane fusion protein
MSDGQQDLADDQQPSTTENPKAIKMSWAANEFIHSPSSKVLKISILSLFATMIAFFIISFYLDWDQSITAFGETGSNLGKREISSKIGGYVSKIYKLVGDNVKQNEIVARLGYDQASEESVDKLQKQLNLLFQKLQDTKSKNSDGLVLPDLLIGRLVDPELSNTLIELERNFSNFTEGRRKIDADYKNEVAPHLVRIAFLQKRLNSIKRSKQAKFFSQQIESTEEELGKLQSQVQSTKNSFKNNYESARQALFQSVRASISRLEYYKQNHQILAPADGVVAKLIATAQSQIQAGQLIMTVIPSDSNTVAEIRVPSKHFAKMKEGQKVYFKLEAFPYQKYGLFEGEIYQIEKTKAFDPSRNMDTDDFIIRATISPPKDTRWVASSEDVNLSLGMRFEAQIVTKRRKLIQNLISTIVGEGK